MKKKKIYLLKTKEEVTVVESAWIYHMDKRMYLIRHANKKDEIVWEYELGGLDG